MFLHFLAVFSYVDIICAFSNVVFFVQGEYRDWDCYQSTLHTYEKDLAYVQYCEAMEKETKVYFFRTKYEVLDACIFSWSNSFFCHMTVD
jgi:hypothetical protein